MVKGKFQKILQVLTLGATLLLLTGTVSFAAIQFNVPAIEAEVAAAVAAGQDPVLASKNAVANAVRAIVAANPEYPGGREALNAAILEALATLKITGLDDTDLFVSANHGLGLTVDPALEAYEAPGAQGRENARNRGGNAYGPGGKPKPGSPT
jgi:hypothetical protein